MAPSTYYAAKTEPRRRGRSATRVMGPVVMQLWKDNYRVYGARKLWKTARRAGHDIGRDQVARLMRTAGIAGVRRGKRVRTTRPDPGAPRHPDLVSRNFTADRAQPAVGHRPDVRADLGRRGLRVLHRRRLQPDDRRLAGRRRTCAPRWCSTRSRWPAGHAANTLPGLTCHSDAGSQFTSIRYGERLGRDRRRALDRHRR